MIKYALNCAYGHAFDAWFPSSDAFDAQAARGLVVCPHCGDTQVRKALMAPAVARRTSPKKEPPQGPSRESIASAPERRGAPPPAAGHTGARAPTRRPDAQPPPPPRAVMEALWTLREKMEAAAEPVGPDFAK